MDEFLPAMLIETVQVFLVGLSILVIIAISCYWLIIPLIVLVIYFCFVRIGCQRIVKKLKYLESVCEWSGLNER